MTSDAVKMAKEALRPFSLDIRPEVPGDTMMDTLAWSADQHRAASLALAALEQAGEPVADFYYPIEMPLNADGHGPATVGEDVTTMTFEVWDQFCDSHGRFARLSDAIQRARQLNALPTLQRLDQEFDAGEAEPFAYMIRDSDGKVFWDEDHCIWTHREDAEEAAEDKGMTMFGVYDGPVPPQSRGQAFDGEGEELGRFGHHPDARIDYECETDALIGMAYDRLTGMAQHGDLEYRILRAMEFRTTSTPGELRWLSQKFNGTCEIYAIEPECMAALSSAKRGEEG